MHRPNQDPNDPQQPPAAAIDPAWLVIQALLLEQNLAPVQPALNEQEPAELQAEQGSQQLEGPAQ